MLNIPNICEAYSISRIIKLSSNLFAACFDTMKLIPAKFIIEQAISNGTLSKGDLVVESSNGNFAMGLALVCKQHGLQLHSIREE